MSFLCIIEDSFLGGTIGLFTGLSLISMVEALFWVCRTLVLSLVQYKKREKEEIDANITEEERCVESGINEKEVKKSAPKEQDEEEEEESADLGSNSQVEDIEEKEK